MSPQGSALYWGMNSVKMNPGSCVIMKHRRNVGLCPGRNVKLCPSSSVTRCQDSSVKLLNPHMESKVASRIVK